MCILWTKRTNYFLETFTELSRVVKHMEIIFIIGEVREMSEGSFISEIIHCFHQGKFQQS